MSHDVVLAKDYVAPWRRIIIDKLQLRDIILVQYTSRKRDLFALCLFTQYTEELEYIVHDDIRCSMATFYFLNPVSNPHTIFRNALRVLIPIPDLFMSIPHAIVL